MVYVTWGAPRSRNKTGKGNQMVVWSMPYYPWKETGESGWSKILERKKRHGLQPEIQARCQVLWESILYEPNHRNQLLSATSLIWKTSMPQIYCSVSILHPATPQSFVAPQICSWHPMCRPDNRTHYLTLQLYLWVWPKSHACFLQGLSSGSAVFPKGSNTLPWQLPTLHNGKGCSCMVSAAMSPRPGVRPAWFPKASALPGNSTNIN